MKNFSAKRLITAITAASLLAAALTACSEQSQSSTDDGVSYENAQYTSVLEIKDMFKKRELTQEADTSSATALTLENGKNITVSAEGVYTLSGSAENCTVIVNAGSDAKVQLVLDGATITNDSSPAILVISADKCYVTTTDSESTLKVTGAFTETEGLNTDAVIYSKDDIAFNGVGALTIDSTDKAVAAKDDLRITGGSYNISAKGQGFDANDSIAVNGGEFKISANDGFHCENSDDDSKGYIYIAGGSFEIDAQDDAFQACSVIEIDDGEINAKCHEGLEATVIQINGGKTNIDATDDGVNATTASKSYSTLIEINGGETTVTVGSGDTDGFDSNGDIVINGGYISVSCNSAFDYDGKAEYNGGTIIVNGEQVDEMPEPVMPGGSKGGKGDKGDKGGK